MDAPFLLPPDLAAGWKILLTLGVGVLLQAPVAALVIGANFVIFNR